MRIGKTAESGTCLRGPVHGIPPLFGHAALLLAIALLLACLSGAKPVFADDELRLTGIVKSIDPKTGIVFVDVQSESCPGIRRFRADDLSALHRHLNQTIRFFIDSSICRDAGLHTILVSWGIKK